MAPGSARPTHPTSPFLLAALQGERPCDAQVYLGAAGLARSGDSDPAGGLGHHRVGPRAGRDRRHQPDDHVEGAAGRVGAAHRLRRALPALGRRGLDGPPARRPRAHDHHHVSAPGRDRVDGAGVARGLDGSLDQHGGGALSFGPVPGQAAAHDGEHVRAVFGDLDPRQDEEARVVDHQRQVLLAQLGNPCDEAVAPDELPGGGGEPSMASGQPCRFWTRYRMIRCSACPRAQQTAS